MLIFLKVSIVTFEVNSFWMTKLSEEFGEIYREKYFDIHRNWLKWRKISDTERFKNPYLVPSIDPIANLVHLSEKF